MNEFFTLLIHLDVKGLLLTPTKNAVLQFFRYVFVGGVATIVDWGVMFLLTDALQMFYLLSAVFAFFAGLLTNYVISKWLVFNACEVRYQKGIEFLGYGIIGAIGLLFTELILYLMTSVLGTHYMISKLVATMLVLFWNYFARKNLLYYS